MSSRPRAWMVERAVGTGVAAPVPLGGGPAAGPARMAIPSSARPGTSDFSLERGGRRDRPRRGVRQSAAEVAVEFGAVGQRDCGHHAGKDDREQCERGEADAERAASRSSSRIEPVAESAHGLEDPRAVSLELAPQSADMDLDDVRVIGVISPDLREQLVLGEHQCRARARGRRAVVARLGSAPAAHRLERRSRPARR